MLGSLAVAAAFLAMGSYARTETVTGVLSPNLGTASIAPPRPGIVTKVFVAEGAMVRAGAPLMEVSAEQALRGGESETAAVRQSLGEQEGSVELQARLLRQQGAAELARQRAEANGIRLELAALQTQIARQDERVAKAETEFRDVQAAVASGFVTKRESQNRADVIHARRQEALSLRRQAASLQSQLMQSERGASERVLANEGEIARLASTRAELGRRRLEFERGQGYVVVAPVSGRVTAVRARAGQLALPEQTSMAIIPDGSAIEAELHVPTRAAGFLALGQEVKLQVDAFPYQRFGTVTARISGLPVAASGRTGEAGGKGEPVYFVTARIGEPAIAAFGSKHVLQPGMTFTASIVTAKRSLFEWLFEPLFAVRERV
ncbi:MAG TPA: HlyD family efflux transporter periplasmic adaptor subunit [Allosphingosinicella sp.]|nr:HlyD family efflux transporter periplasmic adaptor subunit [Allosphingosinicella sp.]